MSKPSLAAVKVAADQARVRNAKLVVVHAMDFSGAFFFGELGSFFGSLPQAVDVPGVLETAKTALSAELASQKIEAEVLVINGAPVSTVHDLAIERGAE